MEIIISRAATYLEQTPEEPSRENQMRLCIYHEALASQRFHLPKELMIHQSPFKHRRESKHNAREATVSAKQINLHFD